MALPSRDADREFLLRSAAILIHDGAVLLEEADDGRGGKQYALPGGHVEFDEPTTVALTREIYEECGLNVEADKLVYVHENFYTHRGLRTHEIGFYFLVDLSSEFPTPDRDGYVPHREAHARLRVLPLGRLREFPVVPAFLKEQLPEDARELFAHPTRHLLTREDGS